MSRSWLTLLFEYVQDTTDVGRRLVVQIFFRLEIIKIFFCCDQGNIPSKDSSKMVNNVFGRKIPTIYHLLYQVGNAECRVLLMTVRINGGVEEGRNLPFAVGTSSMLLPVHERIVYLLERQRM